MHYQGMVASTSLSYAGEPKNSNFMNYDYYSRLVIVNSYVVLSHMIAMKAPVARYRRLMGCVRGNDGVGSVEFLAIRILCGR